MMRALLLAIWMFLGAGQVWADCAADQVRLRGGFGEIAFQVDLADTPKTRSRGLMFREHMARGDGMLFIYDKPQRATFWMKNTLIPLDMIFADKTGVISRIHRGAIPHDTTLIDGGDQVFVVLEINAGLADRYGLRQGDQMQHPAFAQGPAAWPC